MLRVAMFLGMAAMAAPATAQKPPLPSSPMMTALANCQKLTDSAARLACYDKAGPALVGAAQAGDLRVVDRESVRRARRSLFGFALPSLDVFGKDGKDDAPARLESTITSAAPIGNGFYRFAIADGGAVWESTEATQLRDPKRGEPIVITRGALGSFWAKIGKQREIRVRRIR